MSIATARLLVGRTIVAFDARPFDDPNGICHDPVIVLDNGARVSFVVEETDYGGDYGILPIYTPRKKAP